MERYDNQPKDGDAFWPRIPGPLIPGVILIVIGGLFLLDNLHIINVAAWFAYWPVVLIAVGLVKLVDSNHPGGQIAGGVLMVVGGLILADNLGFLRIDQLWPLALIAVGVFLLWSRTRPDYAGKPWWYWKEKVKHWDFGPPIEDSAANAGNMVHEVNVFSGTRRVITSQDFRGGKVSCVFGGVTLDLTGANIAGESATLEISAVYGGAVVRIPLTWDLVMRGGGVFGGYSDQTIHPPRTPETKRLIVRGGAVFGGVTFRN
jgi:hypothetical protein